MPRLVVTINHNELDALVKLALAELRNPRDQARYLLQQQLRRLGFLQDNDEVEKPGRKLQKEGGDSVRG